MSESSLKKEQIQTSKFAGLIGLTALGGALLGFFLQLAVAYFFGASYKTDAFFMAMSTSELLSKLLLGGSITAVFLPVFVNKISRQRDKEAWSLALNLIHLTIIVMSFVLVLLGVFTRPFVNFIAPGFDEQTTSLTTNMLRLLLPSFLFLFLIELGTSMMHSLRRFTIPAFLRIIAPSTSLIILLTFYKIIGIYALAVGALTSSVLQLVLLYYGLRKNGLAYRFVFNPLHRDIKHIFYLVYPFAISVLVTQMAGIVYRILASELSEGSLASLKFAEKITQMITIIFLTSITMVIYPNLSRKASYKDYNGMRDTIAYAIRLIILLILPITIGVIMLRLPLVSFIYQRGSFTAEDAYLTSTALLFLVIGLTTNGISSVLGHATLALQKTRVAVAVSCASQAIAIFLFIILTPKMSLAGLALASSLVPIATAILYALHLKNHISNLLSVFTGSFYSKTLFLAIVLVIALHFSLLFCNFPQFPPQTALFLKILIPSIIGTFVFFGGAYILHISEIRDLTTILGRKLLKYLT